MSLDPKKLSPSAARPVPSITLSATGPDGKPISLGAIKSMERRITRDMTRRRELDSDIPGVTVEIIPGAVTTFELTIERAMLYKSNIIEAFGINGVEDLTQQSIPFDVVEVRNNPDGSSQTVTYTGCYFKDNPITIDVDREWIIYQKASIEVASATVTYNGFTPAIGASGAGSDTVPGLPGTSFTTVVPATSQPTIS